MSLCDAATVTRYLRLTNNDDGYIVSNDQDSVIEDLIDMVGSVFDNYCENNIEATENTEYHSGYGDNILIVNKKPITTISGIWEDCTRSWGDSTLIDSDNYFILESNVIMLKISTFLKYDKSIKIIYTAGYTTIPSDIKLAAVNEVCRIYRNNYMKGHVGVEGLTGEGFGITYSVDDLLPQTKLVLDKY